MSYRLDRYEKKFVITAAQRADLLAEMQPHLRADANCEADAFYPVVSLYYDTPDRDFYWERLQELQSRRKLRVRVYGSNSGRIPPTSFIEIKHKFEGRGVKRRAALPLAVALALGYGQVPDRHYTAAELRLVEEVTGLVRRRQLEPVCVMRYDRQAFAGLETETDLRVTFDSGIRYRMHDLNPVPDDRQFDDWVLPLDLSIMEIKVTGAMPYWLSVMLGEHRCVPHSFSKYSAALEASDPVLRGVACRIPEPSPALAA